jgi:hypothetical protein
MGIVCYSTFYGMVTQQQQQQVHSAQPFESFARSVYWDMQMSALRTVKASSSCWKSKQFVVAALLGNNR